MRQQIQNSNFNQELARFRQNPTAYIMQRGVPQEYATDPNKAIQYLMDNGVVSQAQYNQAKAMAAQAGIKF